MIRKMMIAVFALLLAAPAAVAGENASQPAPPRGPGVTVEMDGAPKAVESWVSIVKFEAVIKADEFMQALVMTGETKNLPDGCIITLEFLFEGRSLATTRKMVASNKFEWRHEIDNKVCLSGKYQATAMFNPMQRQDPELIGRIEREQGDKYTKYKHTANKELMLGTDTKRLAEIEKFKTDFKRFLGALFKLYKEVSVQGDAFKPKDKDAANKADLKNREKAWRSFQEKLERDVANIKTQFTDVNAGNYANYLITRFPDTAANILAICDTALKAAAVASVQGYKAWGEQPPKDDEEIAQGVQKISQTYVEKYLFEPCLIELGLEKKDIGWIEQAPPAPKDEKTGKSAPAPAKGDAPKDKKEKDKKDKK
jgi:hypothetical protein